LIIKILYITTDENLHLGAADRCQGDYIENTILLGLRKILKQNCVEYPRKRILYHDFSDVKRQSLHGMGFSLYHEKMEDIPNEARNLNQNFDVILYGTAFAWGMNDIPVLEQRCKVKFYVDGHDMYGHATRGNYIFHDGERIIGNQAVPCFKGQLIDVQSDTYPTGVGIPESRILPINFELKTQLHQSAYPRYAKYEPVHEVNRSHYLFNDEEEYYKDMSKSWFGLTSKRGGWDALRHYELIAAGCLLLFCDYDRKPRYCAPGDCPAISYNSLEELHSIMNRLVVDGKPTNEYINRLHEQRDWLLKNATTKARAQYVINVLEKYVKN
jgi:hypothetical protein